MAYDFIIATDSTTDLSKDKLREMDIYSRDMLYYVDGDEYGRSEENQLDQAEFYQRMRDGAKTSTSMINEETAREFLTELLTQGKNILYLCFDSALSGTYDNFVRVSDELNKKSENKICVIDSLSATGGEALFVKLVDDKRKQGASFEETCAYAKDVRHRVLHYFIVDDLKYLARGGRLSKSTAFFGNMLNVKPVLHVDEMGKLIPIKKVIGRKKSMRCLVEKMEEKYNKESDIVYITHADCIDDAKFIADQVKEKFGVEPVIFPLGPVIGSHTGPGALTLFFTGDSRKEEY